MHINVTHTHTHTDIDIYIYIMNNSNCKGEKSGEGFIKSHQTNYNFDKY